MTISALAVLVLFLLVTALIARRPPLATHLASGEELLNTRMAPWIVGLGCALAIGYVWGSFDPVPVYHDEAAYLLQAQLFARGLAAGPAPPLPKFFEQFHVLVSPGLAPKYPPGFALAMVPGIWLGLPALMPIVLSGVTGAFLFLLSRKAVGGPVALLATAIWILAPGNLLLHAGYFSQTLTSALWLIGWWALLSWRERRRTSHLVLLGVIVGWMAIARPITALLYAIPLGIVVLRDVIARRAWRGFVIAATAGTSILMVIPLHNRLVTGNWLDMPYLRHTRIYLPFEGMGFGLQHSEPLVPLPPDMVAFANEFETLHALHTVAHLPTILIERLTSLLAALSGGAPAFFGLLVLLGLFRCTRPVLFASLSAAILFIGHLAYAHPAGWLPYYEESFPVFALLAALGISRLVDWALTLGSSAESRPAISSRRSLALLVAVFGLALAMPRRLSFGHLVVRSTASGQARFRDLVRALPSPSIVFVRYGASHVIHYSLITNPPDYPSAPAWIVYDRGADNRRLTAVAPARVPYLYLEDEHRLVLINPATGTPD